MLYYVYMIIPANIIHKYITSKRTATKTLQISIKRPIFLIPGDIMVLDPRNLGAIQILKKEIFAMPLPYKDN